MALLRGGVRTADVVADERVVCYGLTTDHLDALAAADPAIVSTIMRNMAREFANRLGRNNDLIGSFR
jgi:glutaminase